MSFVTALCTVADSVTRVPEVPETPCGSEVKMDKTIVIKTLTGKTILLDVKSTDTIKNVKYMIESLQGIKVDQQQIIVAGKTVNDNSKVADHDASLYFLAIVKNKAPQVPASK
jgi:hypothetical protein